MRVLIGYDGSPCGEGAITDLARAGLSDATEVLVLTAAADVSPSPAPPGSVPGDPPSAEVVWPAADRAGETAQQVAVDARELSGRGAARVRGLFPRWTVRAETSADAPYRALGAKAAQWGADLIVVGSHGRTALGRVLLGSVSQQVLQLAPCSVRIARCAAAGAAGGGGGGEDRPVRLVLGIDGSVDSATAASAVALRAWPAGSEVLVVGVDSDAIQCGPEFDGLPAGGQRGAGGAGDCASRLRESLASVADELRASGLTATTGLLTGDPTRVLLHEAARSGADCVFVGAKGHSRLERLLLGSVSAALAARATCSVEVVRTV